MTSIEVMSSECSEGDTTRGHNDGDDIGAASQTIIVENLAMGVQSLPPPLGDKELTEETAPPPPEDTDADNDVVEATSSPLKTIAAMAVNIELPGKRPTLFVPLGELPGTAQTYSEVSSAASPSNVALLPHVSLGAVGSEAAAAATKPASSMSTFQAPSKPAGFFAAACHSLSAFVLDQFLPLILIFMVVLGIAWPAPAIAASATPTSQVALGGIFFITGLGLDPAAVAAVAGPRSRWALLAGMVFILVLSPAASLALTRLPLEPPEFPLGLALFWAMPTSASAGVMMVLAARGDTALAIALTVVTNIVGVFTAPAWASVILGAVVPVSVAALLLQLAYTVLAPLAVGWALRAGVRAVPPLVLRFKLQLRMMQAFLLSLVPWMLMGVNAATLGTIPPPQMALLFTAVIGLHIVLLAASAAGAAVLPAAVLPAGRKQRVALAIMSTQKTIILAAAIAVALPPGAGLATGLLMLPAVLGHLTQTVLDSVLATLWGRRAVVWEAAEAAAAKAAVAAAAASAAAAPPPAAPPQPLAAPRWLARLPFPRRAPVTSQAPELLNAAENAFVENQETSPPGIQMTVTEERAKLQRQLSFM